MTTHRLNIGDLVSFLLVNQKVKGKVVEDRGKLGRGGRRIYAIRVEFDSADPLVYELTEGDFEVIGKNKDRRLSPA